MTTSRPAAPETTRHGRLVVHRLRADFAGTNCWVVATAPGRPCLVIDPASEMAGRIDEVLRADRLRPVAVLMTHGHLDHVASIIPVCEAHDLPAYLHPGDHYMLTDPWKGLGVEPGTHLAGLGEVTVAEPDDLRPLTDGQSLTLADLSLRVRHAPGHSEGSVVFEVDGVSISADNDVVFTGDLLFAGTVGMTNIPGGSAEEMARSLREVAWPMADETFVHPGHGRSTTIGAERISNDAFRAAAGAEPSA